MSVFVDPLDARRAVVAPALLREFNDAGVLSGADVQVARLVTRLGECPDDELVGLGVALAARAPRLGHVCVDLAGVRESVVLDQEETVDLDALPWPADVSAWVAALSGSGLVDGPLRLKGTLLYLDRYWAQECAVASDLIARSSAGVMGVDEEVLSAGLLRLYGDELGGRQSLAAATAVLQRFTVVAGGPGTGKTTTVSRIVSLLREQAVAAGAREPLVALAAPTGKAAARLQEASGIEASTLHRLLGWRPGTNSRFKHHRGNRLPHDVVIVDETSMVSLPMMSRLLEAVRPTARLILIGDPGQLTSIEAGAVLGDVVGSSASGLVMRAGAASRLSEVVGSPVSVVEPPPGVTVGDGIVVLDRVHRYDQGGAIARVADAIRAGDADAVIEALSDGGDEVVWEPSPEEGAELLRFEAVEAAASVIDCARAGDAAGALSAMGSFRLLCAHRRGEDGVSTWQDRITAWLTEEIPGFAAEGDWYPGRPLLVTENDHGLRLYNGDTGVVVSTEDGRVSAVFERGGEPITYRPSRLGAIDTVFAMTIHKSQGSQFGTATVVLPAVESRLLTRELLYTAVTRAVDRLVVVGGEDAVRAAVGRPIARASGLRDRLWGRGTRVA